jgi:hypothetical protein
MGLEVWLKLELGLLLRDLAIADSRILVLPVLVFV